MKLLLRVSLGDLDPKTLPDYETVSVRDQDIAHT